MTTNPIPPDDPRLTAYALGELDADQRAAVERQIAADPRLLAVIAEIRETAVLLADVLSHEPVPAAARRSSAATVGIAVVPPTPAQPSRAGVVALVTALTVMAAVGALFALPGGDADDRSNRVAVVDGSASVEADGRKYALGFDTALANGRRVELRFDETARGTSEGMHLYAEQAPTSSDFFGNGVVDAASPPQDMPPTAAFGSTVVLGVQPPPSEGNQLGLPPASTGMLSDGVTINGTAGGGSGAAGYVAPETYEKLSQLQSMYEQEYLRSLSRYGAMRGFGVRPGVQPNSPPVIVLEEESQAGVTFGVHSDHDAKYVPRFQMEQRDAAELMGLIRQFEAGGWVPQQQVDFLAIVDGESLGTESYAPIVENAFIAPAGQNALSTFSIDVDTASFSNVRRFLKQGQWPPADAVRVEELLNYFRYDYPPPADGVPFSVTTEVDACPWQPAHRLVRIGLKGREIASEKRPVTNLVFLLDVSGSMQDSNKLPLVQQALELLVGEMNENDRIAIVTYSDDAKLALDSTTGEDKGTILSVIHQLVAGGSTNGAGGIQMAYAEAAEHFTPHGVNRVILCTDGDFNVGISDTEQLAAMVQGKAKADNIFLSVLGFGMGNIQDEKLETLADRGNGHYAYIDDLREARKVFVEELTGTLYTIAKDVKLQVEFNPQHVAAYRLVGYENRVLAAQDFNNDARDAGEIGAGHTVTALYEVIPVGMAPPEGVDPLKYQSGGERKAESGERDNEEQRKQDPTSRELLTVKLRYKLPESDTSTPLEVALVDEPKTAPPSADFEWAASVAAFGMILRDSSYKGQADLTLVRELALGSRGDDADGRRREFIDLVYTAQVLKARHEGRVLPEPVALPAEEAQTQAAVGGKYQNLLKAIEVPADAGTYGPFYDFGYWAGTEYAGQEELPQGHWVYVYPNWYIWGDSTQGRPASP